MHCHDLPQAHGQARFLPELPVTIIADERKLKQILYNLLSNAIKFTPDGGTIHLTAKRVTDCGLQAAGSSFQVRASLQVAPEDFIEISVSDTGIGIEKENLLRIFNPFEQVESSKSRRYQGTGLGLSLTKNLVELHGGKIWAASEGKGKGSTFTCIIPVQTDLAELVSFTME